MLSNVITELKSNILLHTQIAIGPFDARKVDFDALSEVEMEQLGFDIRFPLGAAWDEFKTKWKNLRDFYLEESPSEPPVVPAGDYTISNPAVKNVEVTK